MANSSSETDRSVPVDTADEISTDPIPFHIEITGTLGLRACVLRRGGATNTGGSTAAAAEGGESSAAATIQAEFLARAYLLFFVETQLNTPCNVQHGCCRCASNLLSTVAVASIKALSLNSTLEITACQL